ncbi:MAG: hypothetical protein ACFFCP_11930 [Promethearchaeota archaeon]
MSDKILEAAQIIAEILRNTETKRMPLRELKSRLQASLQVNENIEMDDVIQYALENWIVEKVLDYDNDSAESVGQLEWFLRILSEKEAERFQNLPEASKCFIRILYGINTPGDLGVIRADDALKKLNEKGYDVEYVPYIPDKTDDFFRLEDGELVQFHYLIPEEEKSEEYKAGLKELDEIARKKLDRRER